MTNEKLGLESGSCSVGRGCGLPLSGNSAIHSGLLPKYPVDESQSVKPSEGSTDCDVGGISLVVRIRRTVIALVGRVVGRNTRVLVDLGSTGN